MNKKEETPFLEVNNLTVEYFNKTQVVHAVSDISFQLQKGKTLGLVGETGAGKTSIAKAILRILPDVGARIPKGEVMLNGVQISSIPEKKMQEIRGNEISMIFQDPMTALNPVQRVGDQIAEVIALHNEISAEETKKRTEEMLELVGIPKERYREYPHQFSGGMKQRVVIAMALACNPELLLADEPTTALDVTIQAQVLSLIEQLKEKFNTSMILITHDMGVIAQTCDDVAIVYAGSILEFGSKEQIFKHPSHPYTIGLFNAIPNMNMDEEWLHPIEGLPPDPTNLPEGCPFHPRCSYATEECKHGKVEMRLTEDGHRCACCHFEDVIKVGGK
ncbi:ABC transporter ATP-binding protein [Suonthocola fibrivorans]|nr:ABC transporter ATP-binding protein [Suonthocola fibrivorans]MCU6735112.1 ABC transporter ATP-binding protein [Suonthocola fibrivorans]